MTLFVLLGKKLELFKNYHRSTQTITHKIPELANEFSSTILTWILVFINMHYTLQEIYKRRSVFSNCFGVIGVQRCCL